MSNNPDTFSSTKKLVKDIMDWEKDADLVVLLGDTVDPNYEESYTSRFGEAVDSIKKLGIPWVSAGG